jgi:sugar lactone lactonase YvrE
VRHSTLVGFIAFVVLALIGASALAIIGSQREASPTGLPDYAGDGIDGYRLAGTVGGPLIPTTPIDVAIDDNGRVYVADIGLNRILAFTPEGMLDTAWGDEGISERLVFPASIAIGPDGSLFVLQLGDTQVYVLDSDGAERDSWTAGENQELAGAGVPSAIAVDSTGTVYIPDQRSQQVLRYSSSGEALDGWIFPTSIAQDETLWPRDVVEWDGLMLMSYANPDGTGSGITAFDMEGNIAPLPADLFTAPSAEQLAPGSIAIAPDGTPTVLYLSDEAGTPPSLSEQDENWNPEGIDSLTPINGLIVPGIAYDATGRLYLADSGRQRIRMYDGEHRPVGDISSPTDQGLVAGLDEILVGEDGLLYIADPLLGRVVAYGPDGNVLTIFQLSEDPDEPLTTGFTRRRMRVAVNATGHVYIVDDFTGNITKFRQDGLVLDTDWAKPDNERSAVAMLLAAGNGERLYLVELESQDQIRVFDSDGNDLGFLTDSFWEGAIQDIAVAGDRLYTIDLGVGTSFVRSVSTDGGNFSELANVSSGGSNENRTGFALALEPDGDVLIGAVNVDSGPEFEYQLLHLDTEGNVRRIGTLDVPFTTLPDIAVAPDGTLYIAAPNDQVIYRYEPDVE